ISFLNLRFHHRDRFIFLAHFGSPSSGDKQLLQITTASGSSEISRVSCEGDPSGVISLRRRYRTENACCCAARRRRYAKRYEIVGRERRNCTDSRSAFQPSAVPAQSKCGL